MRKLKQLSQRKLQQQQSEQLYESTRPLSLHNSHETYFTHTAQKHDDDDVDERDEEIRNLRLQIEDLKLSKTMQDIRVYAGESQFSTNKKQYDRSEVEMLRDRIDDLQEALDQERRRNQLMADKYERLYQESLEQQCTKYSQCTTHEPLSRREKHSYASRRLDLDDSQSRITKTASLNRVKYDQLNEKFLYLDYQIRSLLDDEYPTHLPY